MKPAILVLLSFFSLGQKIIGQLPDKILITDRSTVGMGGIRLYKYKILKVQNEYHLFQLLEYWDGDGETSSDSAQKLLGKVSTGSIDSLVREIKNKTFTNYKFENFGYDQNWVNSHIEEIIRPIKQRRTYWNNKQMEFVRLQLSDIKNHKKAADKIVARSMKPASPDDPTLFKATFYFGRNTITVKSFGHLFGFPWYVDRSLSFNPYLPRLFDRLLPESYSITKGQFQAINNLFYYSSINLYHKEHWERKLKEFASLEFQNEILELKDSFNIINVEEYGAGGRYLWPSSQTFRITLKHPEMKKPVFLQFFISKKDSTLYSRDSIKKDVHGIISRIQEIDFLMKYLREDSARKIEISYFDNRTFNDYNIENFNQNPKEWAIYDDKVKEDSSILQYRQLYCGCNFRLDSNYLRQALFFELFEKNDDRSIWVLLPDNTPVLWFFEGENAYRYNYKELGTDGESVQYPCKRLNKSGNIISH